jgi:hypothetical protein
VMHYRQGDLMARRRRQRHCHCHLVARCRRHLVAR